MLSEIEKFTRHIGRRSHNTAKTYGYALRDFRQFLLKNGLAVDAEILEISLDSIQQQHVLSYQEESKKRCTERTVQSRLFAIRAFFDFTERPRPNPAHGIPTKWIEGDHVDEPDDAFLRRLAELPGLSSGDPPEPRLIRDHAILQILYRTGMDVSELVDIRWGDLDGVRRSVSIGEIRRREVRLPDEAWEALMNWKELSPQSHARKAPVFTNFRDNYGRSLTRQGVYKIIKGWAAKLGPRHVNPRAFRNNFAALMVETGADDDELRDALGFRWVVSSVRYRRRLGTQE